MFCILFCAYLLRFLWQAANSSMKQVLRLMWFFHFFRHAFRCVEPTLGRWPCALAVYSKATGCHMMLQCRCYMYYRLLADWEQQEILFGWFFHGNSCHVHHISHNPKSGDWNFKGAASHWSTFLGISRTWTRRVVLRQLFRSVLICCWAGGLCYVLAQGSSCTCRRASCCFGRQRLCCLALD